MDGGGGLRLGQAHHRPQDLDCAGVQWPDRTQDRTGDGRYRLRNRLHVDDVLLDGTDVHPDSRVEGVLDADRVLGGENHLGGWLRSRRS